MKIHMQTEAIKAMVEHGLLTSVEATERMAQLRPAQVNAFYADGPGASGLVADGELYISDRIDSWGFPFGISDDDVRRALAEIDGDVVVHINSPGGEVSTGIAIHNVLADHDGEVHVIVDGAAYSIASVIAMAGDRITMNRGAQFMVHEARAYWGGIADDFDAMADRLRSATRQAALFYEARAGGTADEWLERMADESWYYSDEAIALGLADDVVPHKTKADPEASADDASIWSEAPAAPAADANDLPTPDTTPAAPETTAPAAAKEHVGSTEAIAVLALAEARLTINDQRK